MAQYHEETLLILTKTYPSPSKKHRETSCVAAINDKGEIRRLFPIPYRLLDDKKQFARWEWIRARISKATDDHRPESFKLDVDSIVRLSRLGTDLGWAERIQRVRPHIMDGFDDLEARRQVTGETLGFIRSKSFRLEIEAANTQYWTEEEKAKLIQDGLFDSQNVKMRFPLRKVPFDFYYRYSCQTNTMTTEYRHKITDWEACALFWNCQQDYGKDWEKYFRQKLEASFAEEKELMFLMGTIHRFPDQWLIVGLLYPPKSEARQQALFLTPPSD